MQIPYRMTSYEIVWKLYYGGWGGIRTHGTLPRTLVFKTSSLNRSDTHPSYFFPNRDGLLILIQMWCVKLWCEDWCRCWGGIEERPPHCGAAFSDLHICEDRYRKPLRFASPNSLKLRLHRCIPSCEFFDRNVLCFIVGEAQVVV